MVNESQRILFWLVVILGVAVLVMAAAYLMGL
jgi:hypothetical protein